MTLVAYENRVSTGNANLSDANAAPQHLLGLDLVFSGPSGYAVFDYPGERLLEQDLLDTGGRASAKVADKIKRGEELYRKLASLACQFQKAVWVVETTDWLNRAMPQRERETLKSLALARGLALSAALIYQTAIPICMGVNEVREQVLGHHATKRAQFDSIRRRFNLLSLARNEDNMNVTDAIALAVAFAKIFRDPAFSSFRKDIIDTRLKEAVLVFQQHTEQVIETFGNRSVIRALPDEAIALDLTRLGLDKHFTPEYRKNPAPQGERWASVDISATHPGVVVYDRQAQGNPQIVFHHTFTLEANQPNRKKAQSAYEMAVASNILRALTLLKAGLGIQGVVFEYSDWHRAGRGAEFRADRIAIDSLFFAYGALMAGAYHLKLPLVGVNATAAKAAIAGKVNADKAEMAAAVSPIYPFLKNEHTRDAAALMLTAHGTPGPAAEAAHPPRAKSRAAAKPAGEPPPEAPAAPHKPKARSSARAKPAAKTSSRRKAGEA